VFEFIVKVIVNINIFNTPPTNKTYFPLSHIPRTYYYKVTKQVVWPKLWVHIWLA